MKKILIGIILLCGFVLVLYLLHAILIMFAFGAFEKDYSLTDLKKSYNQKRSEILDLKNYFNRIVPRNKLVEIEFNDDSTLSRLVIFESDSTAYDNQKLIFQEWNVNIKTNSGDSIIQTLGWNKDTIQTLKQKIERANCIGIKSGEPTKIPFKRSGMGMYSFVVFSHPLQPDKHNNYNDSCTYIRVNNELVLEYGGGAVGPQCFYNFD